MSLMSPRASPASRTCPGRASSGAAATGRRGPARAVGTAPAATPWAAAPSTTSAMHGPGGPLTWPSLSPAIAASAVAAASPVTSATWLCPTAVTPAGSSGWPCAWPPRTACPTRRPVGTCGATTRSSCPTPPSRTGSRPPGGKTLATLSGAYLDSALADFSGYLAIDEVYDGPFCVLSVVDNRGYNRLACRVLDHDPAHDDVRAFLAEFKGQLDERGREVRGITTDGSPLYPKVLEELWPDARHQVCEFHVLKEVTKAVLRALAKLRKEMAAKIPKRPRGRPRKDQRAQARAAARQKRRVAGLFENRHLFVRHHLSAAQRTLLRGLTRGLPRLRTLRAIMDEVYRLFDRRCRAQTALQKLAK